MSNSLFTIDEESVDALSAYVVEAARNADLGLAGDDSLSSQDELLTAAVVFRSAKQRSAWSGREKNVLVSFIVVTAAVGFIASLTYIFLRKRELSFSLGSRPKGSEGTRVIHERPADFDELSYARYLRDVVGSEIERHGDIAGAALLDQAATPQRFALERLTYEDTTFLTKPRQILQRYVLLLIYFSTGGASLWNREWLVSGLHECHFEGVGCEQVYLDGDDPPSEGYEDLRVISLDLSGRSLVGEIPSGISMLSRLRRLDMSKNRLQGAIPETLFLHENLGEREPRHSRTPVVGARSVLTIDSSLFSQPNCPCRRIP